MTSKRSSVVEVSVTSRWSGLQAVVLADCGADSVGQSAGMGMVRNRIPSTKNDAPGSTTTSWCPSGSETGLTKFSFTGVSASHTEAFSGSRDRNWSAVAVTDVRTVCPAMETMGPSKQSTVISRSPSYGAPIGSPPDSGVTSAKPGG